MVAILPLRIGGSSIGVVVLLGVLSTIKHVVILAVVHSLAVLPVLPIHRVVVLAAIHSLAVLVSIHVMMVLAAIQSMVIWSACETVKSPGRWIPKGILWGAAVVILIIVILHLDLGSQFLGIVVFLMAAVECVAIGVEVGWSGCCIIMVGLHVMI